MYIIQIMLDRYRFDLICAIGITTIALLAIVLLLLLRRRFHLDRMLLIVPALAVCAGVFFTGMTIDDFFVFNKAAQTPAIVSTTADLEQILSSDSQRRFTPQLFIDASLSQLSDMNDIQFLPVSGEPATLELHVMTDNLIYHLGSTFELHQGQRFSITYEAQTHSLISISPIYTSSN